MNTISFRLSAALGCVACIGGLAFALYLQHGLGLEPCPMCIFQRIAMASCGLMLLIGAAHGPQRGGRWVYAVLAMIASCIGAAIAARQTWLQSLPADQIPACGPTLNYLLKMLPVSEVVTLVLKGDGSCAKIEGEWLGITLPGWSAIAFVVLTLYILISTTLATKSKTSLIQ